MAALLSWLIPFWAGTLGVLVLAVLLSRLATLIWGLRGLLAVFALFWVVLLVGIPLTAQGGPPVTMRLLAGLALFLAASLAIVAVPLHRLGADAPVWPFLKRGFLAAVVSALVSPWLFLFAAALGGDAL